MRGWLMQAQAVGAPILPGRKKSPCLKSSWKSDGSAAVPRRYYLGVMHRPGDAEAHARLATPQATTEAPCGRHSGFPQAVSNSRAKQLNDAFDLSVQ